MSSEDMNKAKEQPTAIHFPEIETKYDMASKKHLERTSTVGSQAIIAYRTLSITVSENQAKGTKTKKDKKNDLTEGKSDLFTYT